MAQDFVAPHLSWALDQFAQELRSDFRRTKQYDGLRAKVHLAALKKQTPRELEVLSRVLPLGVFWEMPDAMKRRDELPNEERVAVEKLQTDYKKECEQTWDQGIRILRRARLREIKNLFKLAVKDGNILQAQIGKQRNWLVARAAPGEWGFIENRDWGRVTVSVNLSRSMTLTYHLNVSNCAKENLRFFDHYLMALGIGGGDWDVGTRDEFAAKFFKACEFGFWHASEYEAILNRFHIHPIRSKT